MKSKEMTSSKTKGYKAIDITTPINGRTVMVDKYWLCKDGNPSEAIFFNGTAQCNQHKQIPDRMKEYTAKKNRLECRNCVYTFRI